MLVHASQVPAPPHASVLLQASANHAQSSHPPAVGPSPEPSTQAPLVRQKPHPSIAVHAAHPLALPQRSGAAPPVHMPASQLRPASQVSNAQQGWRAPPHAGAISQTPALQTRPDAQFAPSQHACRDPPQAVGLSHSPPEHTKPAEHTESQQGSPAPPHPVTTAHVPAEQRSGALHDVLEQHGCPELPHPGGIAQLPLTHVRPTPQRVPSQHACLTVPHSDGSGPASRPPGPPSSSEPVVALEHASSSNAAHDPIHRSIATLPLATSSSRTYDLQGTRGCTGAPHAPRPCCFVC